MVTLRITAGPAHDQSVECDRELVIGREDADVVIDDPEMSRRHAVVRPVDGGVEIEDLGSLNGTSVDGKRLAHAETARHGATVKLGLTLLTVEVRPSDEPIVPVSANTVVTGARPQPAQPDQQSPSEEPIIALNERTVVRDVQAPPVADATGPSEEPIIPVPDATVAREKPIIPVPEATVVRDVPRPEMPAVPPGDAGQQAPPPGAPPAAKPTGGPPPGMPPGGFPAGGFPPGGPPNIPAPVRLLIKSPVGRRLLPRLMRLSPKARKRALLLTALLVLLVIAAVVVGVILLVS